LLVLEKTEWKNKLVNNEKTNSTVISYYRL
jgi:hypothetical protein